MKVTCVNKLQIITYFETILFKKTLENIKEIEQNKTCGTWSKSYSNINIIMSTNFRIILCFKDHR